MLLSLNFKCQHSVLLNIYIQTRKKKKKKGEQRFKLTKLSGPLPVNGDIRPVIRPVHLPRLAERQDGLNRKRHARLAHADGLVPGVVRDPGRGVELGVDAVAAPRGHDAAAPRLGVGLDGGAKVPYGRAGLDEGDGLVETLAGRLDEADRVRVRAGEGTDVIGLVEVRVVAAVVDGYVEVEDVAVDEDAVVGDAMAHDLVGRRAEGFGEVAVV